MYSRYGNDPKRPIRLPEHYSGSTFSQKPTEPISVPKREPVKTYPRGIEEKASPAADRLLRADRAEEPIGDEVIVSGTPDVPDELPIEKEEEVKAPIVEKTPSASPFNFAALRRLFGGKEGDGGDDQDRLLLLGLILLLSKTEGDSDILLWLSLLLLCG